MQGSAPLFPSFLRPMLPPWAIRFIIGPYASLLGLTRSHWAVRVVVGPYALSFGLKCCCWAIPPSRLSFACSYHPCISCLSCPSFSYLFVSPCHSAAVAIIAMLHDPPRHRRVGPHPSLSSCWVRHWSSSSRLIPFALLPPLFRFAVVHVDGLSFVSMVCHLCRLYRWSVICVDLLSLGWRSWFPCRFAPRPPSCLACLF